MDTTLSFTWSKEKINSLPTGDLIKENLFEGQPIHALYDYKYAGIWGSNVPQETLDAYGVKPGWVKLKHLIKMVMVVYINTVKMTVKFWDTLILMLFLV